MSAQEIISSGLLETYALGAATQAEKLEVENMILKYPEVKVALEQVQKDLEAYATLHAVEPDERLREKILGTISATKSTNGKSADAKVISMQNPVASPLKYFAAAASVFLIVSIGINIAQWKNTVALSDAKKKNDSALMLEQTEKALFANQMQAQQHKLDSVLENLNFVRNPMTQNIALNSTIKDHPMKAVVLWNKSSMKVAVDPMTLPATAADEKYVLWAIVDGKPVNEGDFTKTDATGMMMMKVVPQASAFAISLEKSGDVTAPAGPIYVSGAAPSTAP